MRFNILSDSNWEASLEQALDPLSDLGYRQYFEEQDYGAGLAGITVVMMCRDPELNFKQRIRLSKKEKKLYMDIMLDLPEMMAASPDLRKQIVAERLLKEVPVIVAKYKSKIDNFDSIKFISDFEQWIQKTGWVK